MQVQKVSFQNSKRNSNGLSFKNRLIFDVGASDPRGSLKVLVQDNDGNDLFVYKGFVNNTTKGFQDNDDFVKKIAQALNIESLLKKDINKSKTRLIRNHTTQTDRDKLEEKLQKSQHSLDILQSQTPEEKKITGFALLLPGTIQGHVALFMANLKRFDKQTQKEVSLTDVNLDNVIKEAKKDGKVEISDDLKFIPCKDLSGTGIGVARNLINHPEYGQRFTKGFYAVAVQTGGGFGCVDIKVKDDSNVDIETNECSHDLFHDNKTNTEKRLGKLGVSTGSIIENYATAIGIENPDDIKALIKTGLAQIATQQEIKLNNDKDEAAIKILMKTGNYEITNKTLEHSTLHIKSEAEDKFEKASKYAVQAYADGIAQHAITRITRGVNIYVLSGPLAMGLNKSIEDAPEVYGAKDMREMVLNAIDKRVGNDTTCNILRKAHHFDIVCDKSLSVDNNTSGGALLLAGQTKTFARRGEWITLPMNTLIEPAPANNI